MSYQPYEYCPICGETCLVSALPNAPTGTLHFICPVCQFTDRWFVSPSNSPLCITNPQRLLDFSGCNSLEEANIRAGEKVREQGYVTGVLEICAACGNGVNVYRHHTVSLEGYVCSCGHANVWEIALAPQEV